MLGSCFLQQLAGEADFELYAFGREDFDVTDFEKLDEKFAHISPDFVINCVAYTKVDQAETDKTGAFLINADFPKKLVELCNRESATLVHFSTEYVFDGKAVEGYAEEDAYSPINSYGESKMEGEKAILDNGKEFYIIRTSWLYGLNGKNFVDTMLKLLKSQEELKIVGDQIGAPTYTHDLAMAVIDSFLRPFVRDLPEHHQHDFEPVKHEDIKLSYGVYHLTNSGSCSRYMWVQEIKNIIGSNARLVEVASDEFPLPAKRPACSILINKKTPPLRSWQDALKAYLHLHL